jgi:hypothetical protein
LIASRDDRNAPPADDASARLCASMARALL